MRRMRACLCGICLALLVGGVGVVEGQQILDNGGLVNRVFTIDDASFPGDHEITLTNSTVAFSSMITCSGPPAFQSISFPTPSGSLTINAGNGNNIIHLEAMDPTFNAPVHLNGEEGADTINIRRTVAGTTNIVLGGLDNDTFNVGSTGNDLSDIQGDLIIGGELNPNTPQAELVVAGATNAAPVGDTVNLLDRGLATSASYQLSLGQFTRAGIGAITLTTVETLQILMSNGGGSTLSFPTASAIGNVSIIAGNGNDTLELADVAFSGNMYIDVGGGADDVTIASTQGGSFLKVDGGLGGDMLTLTNAGLSAFVEFNGEGGTDSLNLLGLGQTGGARLDGGLANDTLRVFNRGLGGDVRSDVAAIGGGGTDTLIFSDAGHTGTSSMTLTASDFTLPFIGSEVAYQVEDLILNFGTGADELIVNGTHAGTITVDLNDGDDTFTGLSLLASSTQVDAGMGEDTLSVEACTSPVGLDGGDDNDIFDIGGPGNLLNGIQGTISIVGGAENATPTYSVKGVLFPRGDLLLLNDASNAAGNSYLLTGTLFNRTGVSALNHTGLETLQLTAGTGGDSIQLEPVGTSSITVAAGNGADDITVKGTGTNALVTVMGGLGQDTITLESAAAQSETHLAGQAANDVIDLGSTADSLQTILGDVFADGDANTANPTTTLKSNSLPTGDTLLLRDQGDAGPRVYSVGSADVQRGGATLVDHGTFETIILNGSINGSTTDIGTLINMNREFHGGSGPDQVTLLVAGGVNTLVNTDGGEDIINVGTVDTGSATEVNAGAGNDVVNFGGVVQNLDGLEGEICVNGGAHGPTPTSGLNGNQLPVGDVLNINDQGDSSATNYVLSATNFVRTSSVHGVGGFEHTTFETFNLNGGGAQFATEWVQIGADASLNVDGGGGSDTVELIQAGNRANTTVVGAGNVRVRSTSPDSQTDVAGTAFNDVVVIGSGTGGLPAVQGDVHASGGANSAVTFNEDVFSPGPTVTVAVPQGDILRFDDSGNSSAVTAALSIGSLTHDGTAAGLIWDTFERAEYLGGSSSNNVMLQSMPGASTVSITGGPTADELVVLTAGPDAYVTLDGVGGNDLILVQDAGTGTIVRGSGGDGEDVLRLVTNRTATGIHFEGDGDNDLLLVQDSGTLSALQLNGGAGSDTNRVDALGAGTGLWSRGNEDADTIKLRRLPADGAADLYGDDGSDIFVLGTEENGSGTLGEMEGGLFVWGGNHDALPEARAAVTAITQVAEVSFPLGDQIVLHDAGSANIAYEFTSGAFKRDGVTLYNRLELEALEAHLGSGDKQISINGVPSSNHTAIVAGPDDERFVILGMSDDSILDIKAGDGNDEFVVSGVGSNAALLVMGQGGNDDFFQSSPGDGVAYSIHGGLGADTNAFADPGVGSTLEVTGGGGDDVLTVVRVPAGTSVELEGDGGNDILNVAGLGTDLDDVVGDFLADGGSHDPTPTVTSKSLTLAVGDTLVIDESNTHSGDTYEVEATSVSRVGSASIAFTNLETVVLETGSSEEQLNIRDLPPAAHVIVDLGSDADTGRVFATRSGSMLTVDGFLGDDEVIIHAVAAGSVVNVNGGDQDDTVLVGTTTNGADAVLGEVCFHGETGVNALEIHDELHVSPAGYLFTTGGVSRAGAWLASYENVATVDLFGAAAGSSYAIEGVARVGTASSQRPDIAIEGGVGVDTFDIDFTTPSNEQVDISINAGGTGNDSFRVGSPGNNMDIVLSGTEGDNLFVFEDGPISSGVDLTMDGLGGRDKFDVVPPKNYFSDSVTVNGGNPTVAPGDLLKVDGGGRSDQMDLGTFIAFGTGSETGRVHYTGIEHVGILSDDIIAVDQMGTNVTLTVPGLSSWDIVPEYSTNLNPPQVWFPGVMYTNTFTDGTNVIHFEVTDPNPSTYFYRINFQE